jgi:hypothetical protein
VKIPLPGFDQNREFTGWNPYGCIEKCQQNFKVFNFTPDVTFKIMQKIKKSAEILLFLAIFPLTKVYYSASSGESVLFVLGVGVGVDSDNFNRKIRELFLERFSERIQGAGNEQSLKNGAAIVVIVLKIT